MTDVTIYLGFDRPLMHSYCSLQTTVAVGSVAAAAPIDEDVDGSCNSNNDAPYIYIYICQ